MSTEIQRIPGPFALAAGWPRLKVGDLTSGLLAEFSGADLTAADGSAVGTPGTGPAAALPWTSSTGQLHLTTANTAPGSTTALRVHEDPARFGGARYGQFVEGLNGLRSAQLPTPYTGPVTVAGYARWSPRTDFPTRNQWLVSTRASTTGGYHGLFVKPGTTPLLFMMSVTGTAPSYPPELSVAFPANTDVPIIACFNGPSSYLQVGSTLVRGAVGLAGYLGSMGSLLIGNNSGGDSGLNGGISRLRVYDRALTEDEAYLTAAAFRAAA